MSLPLSRHSGRSGPLSAFCLPRGLAARSLCGRECPRVCARQSKSPARLVDYYSPGYHPCSALGFTKAEPREGDNQGRIVDYCSLLARGESGEKRDTPRDGGTLTRGPGSALPVSAEPSSQ